MHSTTRIESKEQVDYSGVSGSVNGLGSFTEDFDEGYFTPYPSYAKASNLQSDELGSDDRTPSASGMPKAPIPPEPSLLSPTLAASCSKDSFLVVVGVPSTFQLVVTTPSMIVAKIPSTISLPTPATLPVGGEDSLKFSFEATSGTGEASSNGSPSKATPVGPVAPVTSTGGASLRIPNLASS